MRAGFGEEDGGVAGVAIERGVQDEQARAAGGGGHGLCWLRGMMWMKRLRGWVLGVVCAIVCVQASLGAEEVAGGKVEAEAHKAGVLREALAARSVVTFNYKGRERTVEPHALGRASDDKLALLAWQTSGGSNTESPPGWRVFIVAEIEGLAVTTEKFEKPRADYGAKGRGLKSVEAEVAAAEKKEAGK
jgi:hypothetical protein